MPDEQQRATSPKPPDTTNPEPPHKRPRRWPWILAGVVLAVVAAAFFMARRGKAQAPAARGRGGASAPPLMVGTAKAQKGNIGVYVNALGLVTPINTVAVRSRVDGQLLKVDYTEGQTVHENDLLIEIDAGPYQAALTQAEGQLARDTALLENARLDLSRYQEAFSKNAIPKQQLDTQASTVHQYEGALKLDEGQIRNARMQLAYTGITAPIPGRVGLRLVE